MLDVLIPASSSTQTTPIVTLTEQQLPVWASQQSVFIQEWLKSTDFKAKSDSHCLIPNSNGGVECVLFGYAPSDEFWVFASLAARLPTGVYHYQPDIRPDVPLALLALAWGLGQYQFTRYKVQSRSLVQLALPESIELNTVQQWLTALYQVRDLINTPTEDMGPAELAAAVQAVGDEYGAVVHQIVGDALLTENYPTIHAVGRAAARAPRLIDLRWGHESAPKITLVGKGVCFDSGGLNLKPAAGMLTMKKDMAGAAHALGLARMIMAQGWPVRLRLLIPAVENSVSGNSYRPGDIIKTRSGKTVEITNTDAEGRLVLCDALSEACGEKPEVLIDFASLTGAASVALGPYVPAFFANQDALAEGITRSAEVVKDWVWRMPLYQPYRRYMQSGVADIANASSVAYAGAITAALYLQSFVSDDVAWAHFDLSAWNEKGVMGRSYGGEALALRAVFHCLQARYSAT